MMAVSAAIMATFPRKPPVHVHTKAAKAAAGTLGMSAGNGETRFSKKLNTVLASL
jgi:hypothetical protein